MTETLFDTTPETVNAAAKLEILQFKISHKRGPLTAFGVKMWDTRVVMKRCNRLVIENNPAHVYLVNDWQHPGVGSATYYRTRKEAIAAAHRLVRAGVAEGIPARF